MISVLNIFRHYQIMSESNEALTLETWQWFPPASALVSRPSSVFNRFIMREKGLGYYCLVAYLYIIGRIIYYLYGMPTLNHKPLLLLNLLRGHLQNSDYTLFPS